MIFQGIITALITPFKNGKIDYKKLYGLIEKQIDAKINGIIIAGSTGEGNSLEKEEYHELLRLSVEYASKNIPIIAAISAATTMEAIKKISDLSNIGIDAFMCTAPHYIRPEQDGLVLHYKAINDISTLPIMLYVHPVRTACDFDDNTLLEISQFKRIEALKDATNDLEKPLRIAPYSKNFNMLTGNDTSLLSYNANGGSGLVSVIANIAPKLCKKIDNSWRAGDISTALELQRRLIPLLSAINMVSNPIGIKYAASTMNLCSSEMRLPLTEANSNITKFIDTELKNIIILENNV